MCCCILAFFRLCSYMCTRLFVCLFGWFFRFLALYIHMLVCFIFCRGFLICFIVFFVKLIIFECFNYFADFVGVAVPIWADNVLQNSVLVAFHDFNVHNLGQGTSFCEVSAFFVAFFSAFRTIVFFSYLFGFEQFKFVGFGGLFLVTHTLPSALLIWMHGIDMYPFFCQLYPQKTRFDHLTHSCQVPVFFFVCMYQKHVLLNPFRALFVCFFLPPAWWYVPLSHSYPTLHTYTNFWTFLAKSAKHHVRGNFPVHNVTKIPARSCFWSVCLVFTSPCAPCIPLHPSAPIHTRFHPFIPVCTLNYNQYMYNLIEK